MKFAPHGTGVRAVSSTPSSRRQFLRMASAAGAALAAGPALAACADQPGAGAGAPGTVKLIHASKDPLLVFSSSYLAEDGGFYKKEGLTVERVLLGGGPAALTGLLSGAGHANLSTPGELLAAVTKGQRLKTILAGTNRQPCIFVISKDYAGRAGVTQDSPLAQRQSAIGRLKGGRFGVTAPGSQTDGFTRLVLRQAGLDPTSDATIVPLQTANNMIAALANDQIDGFMGVPPSAEQAVLQFAAVPLLVNQNGEIKGAEQVQGITMQARAADIEKDRDLYQAIVRAEVAGLRSLVTDPEAAGTLLRRTRFSQLDEPIWEYAWRLVQRSWVSPRITTEGLAAWFQAGIVSGDPASLSFDDVVDMRFVDEALTAIGWTPQVP